VFLRYNKQHKELGGFAFALPLIIVGILAIAGAIVLLILGLFLVVGPFVLALYQPLW